MVSFRVRGGVRDRGEGGGRWVVPTVGRGWAVAGGRGPGLSRGGWPRAGAEPWRVAAGRGWAVAGGRCELTSRLGGRTSVARTT